MNANTPSTATTDTLTACAAMAAQPPWKMVKITTEAWVPVMHDGEPCLHSPVTNKVGGFATQAEAEAVAYNCTSYGGPNTVKLMTLEATYETYVKNPGFAGYRLAQ
jgi:hypothetical protein